MVMSSMIRWLYDSFLAVELGFQHTLVNRNYHKEWKPGAAGTI